MGLCGIAVGGNHDQADARAKLLNRGKQIGQGQVTQIRIQYGEGKRCRLALGKRFAAGAHARGMVIPLTFERQPDELPKGNRWRGDQYESGHT